MRRLLGMAAAALASVGCTSASVYAVSGAGPEGPDRTLLQGTICAPLPTGKNFPVKIVFAVEGGNPVQPQDITSIISAIQGVSSLSAPGSEFALVTFHTVAKALLGSFGDATALGTALNTLQAASAATSGPVSLEAPLNLANAIISGDMQTGCVATLRRTHYFVVLLLASADESCTNPIFADQINALCGGLTTGAIPPDCGCIATEEDGGTQNECTSCILGGATAALKDLGTTYGGVVSVVPVYYVEAGTLDPVVQSQVQEIATAAGTQQLVTSAASLEADLSAYPFNSLLSTPILTRLFGWNLNVIARGGEEYLDSDGDGLTDDDELNIFHTRPDVKSTAGDGISDGVKVKMGLDPTLAVTNVCDATHTTASDMDGDRLNDCEELLLGTDPCAADTDGDGISDLVEVHVGTNPLVPEQNKDSDGDGISNVAEIEVHTDPDSADLAFRAERAVWSNISVGTPTPDGRPCYDFQIGNISLMYTLARSEGFIQTPAGTNDIYVYAEWGYQGGAEIGDLAVQSVLYDPPAMPQPTSPILLGPADFIEGT